MHQHYSGLILLQVQPFDDSFLIEEKCQRINQNTISNSQNNHRPQW